MKKFRLVILLFVLLISACGCGSQQNNANKKIQKQLDKLQRENEKLNERLEEMQNVTEAPEVTVTPVLTSAPVAKEDETPTPVPTVDAALSAEKLYEMAIGSVVEINGYLADGTSTGTGFFYDNQGTVITNYHVIDGCGTAYITLSDGTSYDVIKVLGYSEARDIAILQTSCTASDPLKIRTSSVKTGETVYAIGSSLGLEGSLSDGLISSAEREVEGNIYIQTTAPISSGNSGGPLLDKEGQVVGITSASFIDGQNLNLAIPIGDVRNIPTNAPVTLADLFGSQIEWLMEWDFFYYEEEDCYVLAFQLGDEYKNPVTGHGTVELTIKNDDGVLVYEGSGTFTEDFYEDWIYDDGTEISLITFYISPENITKGSSSNGEAYLIVYGDGFDFEEVTMDVCDLPTEATQEMEVYCDDLPFEADTYGYFDNRVQATVTVTEIFWEVVYGDSMQLTFSGEKTYDRDGYYGTNSGEFYWYLYDRNDNYVDSGYIYLPYLTVGEHFEETVYSMDTIDTGMSYTVYLEEATW